MTTRTLDRDAADARDLARARGILADCCHHSDAVVMAACDTILLLDRSGDDAHQARTLRATLEMHPQ